ncbi:hypothetical protein BJP27_00545 [Pseudomonas oryzihabitans]|nr:hypothetical protein BJP27_00545 [Pseudomonas psychrotolerans]
MPLDHPVTSRPLPPGLAASLLAGLAVAATEIDGHPTTYRVVHEALIEAGQIIQFPYRSGASRHQPSAWQDSFFVDAPDQQGS